MKTKETIEQKISEIKKSMSEISLFDRVHSENLKKQYDTMRICLEWVLED